MERYGGSARLEWWANTHACLGAAEVNLEVALDATGWHASARFTVPPVDEEFEAWSLMLLDPCFILRLLEDEQAAIEVRVEQPQLAASLALTAI